MKPISGDCASWMYGFTSYGMFGLELEGFGNWAALCRWFLRSFCHRRGIQSRVTPAPLYCLRLALYFFWLNHLPPFLSYLEIRGVSCLLGRFGRINLRLGKVAQYFDFEISGVLIKIFQRHKLDYCYTIE